LYNIKTTPPGKPGGVAITTINASQDAFKPTKQSAFSFSEEAMGSFLFPIRQSHTAAPATSTIASASAWF
jgi:hypothetical protein